LIKKTITFENYNGEKETEDFYFNMSKGELVKMQMAAIDQKTESFQDKIEKIGKNLNGKALIEVFDEIILGSIGQRTTDGKKFMKSAAITDEFKSSEAYSELIVELCTDDKAAVTFINGLIPKNLREDVNREVNTMTARERSEAQMQGFQQKTVPTQQTVTEVPTIIQEETVQAAPEPNRSMLDTMSREELEAMVIKQRQSEGVAL
jgi:hypothetical protein